MKRYYFYKEINSTWINSVPSHWDVGRLKYITTIKGGFAFKSDDFCDTGLPIVRIGDIRENIIWEQCKKIPQALGVADEFLVVRGDTLVALSGATTGKTCFVGTDPPKAFLNQRVAKVGSKNKMPFYLLNSDFIQGQIDLAASGSAQENISNTQIGNLEIPIPPLPEQTAITNYLDQKTAIIDQLIQKSKEKITQLQELRTATINQAVTGGLDPNVPMKDSGVEWIGEIPEGWTTKSLKYTCDLKSGTNLVSDDLIENGSFPVYGGNGLRGFYNDFTHDGLHVLIGRQGALCGNINYGYGKFWATEHAVVAKILDGSDPKFLHLSGTINTGTYQAEVITANGTVPNGALVFLKAVNHMDLLSDFTVITGGQLEISLDGCN